MARAQRQRIERRNAALLKPINKQERKAERNAALLARINERERPR